MAEEIHTLSEEMMAGESEGRAPLSAYEDMAARVAVSLADPVLTEEAVYEGCQSARVMGMGMALLRPSDVDLAKNWLSGSSVKLVCATGYPGGSSTTAARLYEGRDVLRRGAAELALTVNLGKLLSRKFLYLESELLQMAENCRSAQAKFRLIFEVDSLQRDHVLIGVRLCKRTGVDVMDLWFDDSDAERQATIVRYVAHHAKGKIEIGVHVPKIALDGALLLYDAGANTFATRDASGLLESWRTELARRKEEGECQMRENAANSSSLQPPTE